MRSDCCNGTDIARRNFIASPATVIAVPCEDSDSLDREVRDAASEAVTFTPELAEAAYKAEIALSSQIQTLSISVWRVIVYNFLRLTRRLNRRWA